MCKIKALNLSEQKQIYGGGVTGSLISAAGDIIELIVEIGRGFGSNLRRLFGKKMCKLQ